jgi:uncharacterized protein (DUF885 family)
MIPRLFRGPVAAVSLVLGSALPLAAQNAPPTNPLSGVPTIASLMNRPRSEFTEVVTRFSADETSLTRRYDAADSPDQRARMRNFYTGWRTRLREADFNGLSQEAKVDYILLDNYLVHELALLDRTDKERAETQDALSFADDVLTIYDARRRMENLNPMDAARKISAIAKSVDSLRALFEAPAAGGRGGAAPAVAAPKLTRSAGMRAASRVDQLRGTVGNWYRYYDGYDPLFSWWVADPYRKLDDAMTRYARTLRERVVGWRQTGPAVAAAAPGGGGRGGQAAAADEPIVGVPIGADGLQADLAFEMIPYTAEELIAIAEREYAFSLSEAKKAAREMGFGDDWRAASDKVKDMYVEPGKQIEIIRDLARQAEQYFAAKDWVTIPELATEDWKMEMLSPERQRVSPFFLGGESILVSYPTNTMTDEEKMMSMRGNNPHFSHATVFHELNPGHHFQGFMTQRYNAHRRMFNTPFWNEGIALYWEMFVWDEGFHASPEDRLGALFWRMHRSARIIFSLSFHLGKMTPEQAIDLLVETVNFERANAEAEVRRSFNGSYSPLYQAAYMLGGLQMRALHGELVRTGKMTNKQFHDAVMEGGPMPMTMVRARLTNQPLQRTGATPWRFADAVPAPKPFPSK